MLPISNKGLEFWSIIFSDCNGSSYDFEKKSLLLLFCTKFLGRIFIRAGIQVWSTVRGRR